MWWMVLLLICAIAYYKIILVDNGNLNFWKAAQKHPAEAMELFLSNDCFVVFYEKPIDGYRQNLPTGNWVGGFRWVNPYTGKTVVIYGRNPDFESAQSNFLLKHKYL